MTKNTGILIHDLELPKVLPKHWGRIAIAYPNEDQDSIGLMPLIAGLRCKQALTPTEATSSDQPRNLVWDGYQALVIGRHRDYEKLWEHHWFFGQEREELDECSHRLAHFLSLDEPTNIGELDAILSDLFSVLNRGGNVLLFDTNSDLVLLGLTVMCGHSIRSIDHAKSVWGKASDGFEDVCILQISTEEQDYLFGILRGRVALSMKREKKQEIPSLEPRGGTYEYSAFQSDLWLLDE